LTGFIWLRRGFSDGIETTDSVQGAQFLDLSYYQTVKKSAPWWWVGR